MTDFAAYVIVSANGGEYPNVAFLNKTDAIDVEIALSNLYVSPQSVTINRIAPFLVPQTVSTRGANMMLGTGTFSKCKLFSYNTTVIASAGPALFIYQNTSHQGLIMHVTTSAGFVIRPMIPISAISVSLSWKEPS